MQKLHGLPVGDVTLELGLLQVMELPVGDATLLSLLLSRTPSKLPQYLQKLHRQAAAPP